MSLFNTILSAIDNPDLLANSGQLAGILNSAQQLSSSYRSDPSAVESAMSVVGKYVRSSLQEQRNSGTEAQAQALVNQFSGTQPSTQAVQALFSNLQIQSIIQEVKNRTGLDAKQIQGMLPMLVPLVLNFLQTGTNKLNPQGANSVLSNFLDADGDGDVDMMDAIQMASRYLQK